MSLMYVICLCVATTAAYFSCKWVIFPYLTIAYERQVIRSFMRMVSKGKLAMSEESALILSKRLIDNNKEFDEQSP